MVYLFYQPVLLVKAMEEEEVEVVALDDDEHTEDKTKKEVPTE